MPSDWVNEHEKRQEERVDARAAVDIDALEALAKAATPDVPPESHVRTHVARGMREADARFAVAAHPGAVLWLVREIRLRGEEARQLRERLIALKAQVTSPLLDALQAVLNG